MLQKVLRVEAVGEILPVHSDSLTWSEVEASLLHEGVWGDPRNGDQGRRMGGSRHVGSLDGQVLCLRVAC